MGAVSLAASPLGAVATDSTQLVEPTSPSERSLLSEPPSLQTLVQLPVFDPRDSDNGRVVRAFTARAQLLCAMLAKREELTAEDSLIVNELRRFLWEYWSPIAHALLLADPVEAAALHAALELKRRAEALHHARLPPCHLQVTVRIELWLLCVVCL